MIVNTFNEKELKQHLKTCDPYILQYIEALKNVAKGWEDVAKTALKKIRASAHNSDYTKCPQCGSKGTFLYRTCGACDWNDHVW